MSNFISLLSLKHLSASLSKAYSKGLKKSSFIWPLTNEFTIIYLGPDRYLIQYKSPTILIIFVDAPFRLLTFSLTLDPKTIITAKRTIVDRIQKLVTKRRNVTTDLNEVDNVVEIETNKRDAQPDDNDEEMRKHTVSKLNHFT